MAQILQLATPFLMALVAIILGLGLWNMARGGSANRSQKLMRYRVLAQAVAVVAMIAAVYYTRD
ncbi:MAG: twin transmembrane helix small protein [Rhizobiaceae bacterium]|nr:twin transmembrane helix small protein [Rhizobiaceae bacterium]